LSINVTWIDELEARRALANSTQFEAEASTARKLAEQLIAAHNITLGPGRPSQDTIVPFAKGMRWERKIAGALAECVPA
jgi:hypothetical protein